jgi:Putative polyhydroxyalkanoic acid system protein (PHA_gran_rgn)
VKITIEHHRKKKDVVEAIDKGFDDAFKEAEGLPVKVTLKHKSWNGSTLSFQLAARMGILSTPIKGTVDVTDEELIIDADLGLLSKFIPEAKAKTMLGGRIRGLLKSSS